MPRRGIVVVALVAALVAAWMASAAVPGASAAVCVPRGSGQPDYCPEPPPPPPEPDCSLDPPPGQICRPGPKEMFVFEGAAANGQLTQCTVWLYGATPPDQNGGELVQFRSTTICNRAMRNITLDTTLLGPLLGQIATGPRGYCHEFSSVTCGASLLISSTGQIGGRGPGEYTLVAHVRLALREGNADPWVVVHGTTPAGSAEKCLPGSYVTYCDLRLVIPADGL